MRERRRKRERKREGERLIEKEGERVCVKRERECVCYDESLAYAQLR